MFEDMGDSDSYFRAFFEQKIKQKYAERKVWVFVPEL